MLKNACFKELALKLTKAAAAAEGPFISQEPAGEVQTDTAGEPADTDDIFALEGGISPTNISSFSFPLVLFPTAEEGKTTFASTLQKRDAPVY